MDTVYKYFNVSLRKEVAVYLGYLPASSLSKLDYQPNIKGRLCLRIQRPPIGTPGKQTYAVSFSFCSPVDQFNRKLARRIADGRAKVSAITITADSPMRVSDVATEALGELLANCSGDKSKMARGDVKVNIPNWLSHAAFEDIVPEYRKKR